MSFIWRGMTIFEKNFIKIQQQIFEHFWIYKDEYLRFHVQFIDGVDIFYISNSMSFKSVVFSINDYLRLKPKSSDRLGIFKQSLNHCILNPCRKRCVHGIRVYSHLLLKCGRNYFGIFKQFPNHYVLI